MVDCDHQHTQTQKMTTNRLLWAFAVISVFMVVEVVGGVISGSLALLADATHMLTDALALALAVSAQFLAARPPDSRLHYGYRRAQVLAAFVNGIFLAFLLIWIVFEAVQRFVNPVEVDAPLMLWVAAAGFVANIVAFFILHRPNESNVNMRGAMLHVVGDLLGSVAAIVAAIVISMTGWLQIDPILSILVAVLIGVSAIRLVRETGFILLEGAPESINVGELAAGLVEASPLIRDVHDIKISQITPDQPRLTMHACVENAADAASALEAAKAFLDRKYKIRNSTIQVEVGEDCPDRVFENETRHVKAAKTNQSITDGAASGGAAVLAASD